MSKLDMYIVENAFKVVVVLLIALILSPIPSVHAAVLYSYNGPDRSNDLLELSDFEVTGPEPLKVGDTLSVVFTLKSVEVPIEFDRPGVFVAARDPEGMNRDFGHVYQDDILDSGKSINFKAVMTVDKEGEWIFWPSYYIKENSPYYYEEGYGPDRWHACYLDVVSVSTAQPDLIVEDIFWDPPNPRIDEQVTVGVVIKDIGDAPSGENDLILWGCCDLTSRVPTLEPDKTTTIYFEDSPLIFREPGEFRIIATIDDANEISESNEENNERTEFIILETMPTLSVSISTNSVPSGESDKIKVRVFSDGNPVAGATIHLSSAIGSLDPTVGRTDDSGEFVSTYTAPVVSTTQRYTISAAAEREGYTEGKNSVSDSILIEQLPTPTPPPVVTPIPTPEETPTPTPSPSRPIVPIAIAAIAAVTVLIYVFKGKKPPEPEVKKEKERESEEEEKRQYGSISASSNPDGVGILLDGIYPGRSPMIMDNILTGHHVVGFVKFGYFDCEREAMVNENQTTHVHCDLTEIPAIKLKLSAEPSEIPAGGKSKSTITIRIEDKDGIPIPVPEDVRVELGTNIGTIESPVKIPAGHASVTATLTSSAAKGTATVKAKAEFLKGRTTVEFLQST